MTYENNILYVDREKLTHKMNFYNKKSKMIKLLLGEIHPEEFEVTTDTIKNLPEDEQIQLRNYIRSIFV